LHTGVFQLVAEDSENCHLKVGDEVSFSLDYGALLAAMTSPFISKHFIGQRGHPSV